MDPDPGGPKTCGSGGSGSGSGTLLCGSNGKIKQRFRYLQVAGLSRSGPAFSDIQIRDKVKEVRRIDKQDTRRTEGGLITVEVCSMGGGQWFLLSVVSNLDRFDADLDMAFLFDSGSDWGFRNRSLLKVVHKSKEKTKTNYGIAKNYTTSTGTNNSLKHIFFAEKWKLLNYN